MPETAIACLHQTLGGRTITPFERWIVINCGQSPSFVIVGKTKGPLQLSRVVGGQATCFGWWAKMLQDGVQAVLGGRHASQVHARQNNISCRCVHQLECVGRQPRIRKLRKYHVRMRTQEMQQPSVGGCGSRASASFVTNSEIHSALVVNWHFSFKDRNINRWVEGKE